MFGLTDINGNVSGYPSVFVYGANGKLKFLGGGGGTGTVTSVGLSMPSAFTVTNSPVTLSGILTVTGAGTTSQYIRGDGTLDTFPTIPTVGSWGTLNYPTWTTGTPFVKMTAVGTFALDTNTYLTTAVTSVATTGLISGGPITTTGTITTLMNTNKLVGRGTAGSGIMEEITLGTGLSLSGTTLNASGGGGSSVSYYLNGGTNQGIFVGNTYYQMSKTAVIGVGVDFTIAANGYISSFITDAGDPALLSIPAGNWNFEMYFSSSSAGGSPSFYVELYKYDGAAFTLIASSSAVPEGITNGTSIDLYLTSLAIPATVLTVADRLAVRVYVNNSSKTIKLHTQDSHLCQIITNFSTGITVLNGLTPQVQTFATGTTGTDFAISSSVSTHTFNIPTASALNRGLLSTADWTTFNNKVTSLSAGTGISIGGTTTVPTVTNTAPDQTVALTAGTGISVSGTYPNFTITNTISPTNNSIISANLNAIQIASGATNYFTFFGTNASTATTELPRQIPSPIAMTLSKFYFRTNSIQSGTGSLVINVRKNAANTGITITIAAGSAIGTFTDLSNTASIAAGDLLTLQIINSATASAAQMNGWTIIGS